MKTSDVENRFSNNPQKNEIFQKERIDDAPVNESLNAERIITDYKKTNKIYYDNSAISMSFGQHNIEKCLFVLLFLIIFSTYLAFSYFLTLDKAFITSIVTGCVVDLIISLIYLYLLIKLRSDHIFNKIPIQMISVSDCIILANIVIKTISFLMSFANYKILGFLGFFLFLLKYLFDVYFTLISVKLFMFCPCSIYVHEQTENLWNSFKYYLFCCEIEQAENMEYTRLEDLDSFE
jgi:hypothetical protein